MVSNRGPLGYSNAKGFIGIGTFLIEGFNHNTNYGHNNSPASIVQLGLSLVNFQVLYTSDNEALT